MAAKSIRPACGWMHQPILPFSPCKLPGLFPRNLGRAGDVDIGDFVIAVGSPFAVYRVDPSQTNPNNFHTVLNVATVWATGFWPIHGCTFGPNGSFWVSEIYTEVGPRGPRGGEVVRVPWNEPNDPSLRTTYGAGQLDAAGGIAVANDGTVYVANKTTSASGEVLRFRP